MRCYRLASLPSKQVERVRVPPSLLQVREVLAAGRHVANVEVAGSIPATGSPSPGEWSASGLRILIAVVRLHPRGLLQGRILLRASEARMSGSSPDGATRMRWTHGIGRGLQALRSGFDSHAHLSCSLSSVWFRAAGLHPAPSEVRILQGVLTRSSTVERPAYIWMVVGSTPTGAMPHQWHWSRVF